MELALSVILILGALLAGAASPGPSFVLIARIAMGVSRIDAIAASIGMGVGGILFSILALSGLHTVLTNVPALYLALKILGGLYLIYLAIRIWRESDEPLQLSKEATLVEAAVYKSSLLGFIAQIANPKTAIVYASIFAALLPKSFPNIYFLVLPPLVFLVEAGWYLLVTLVLSSATPRVAYLRSKSLFDRIAGTILAGLGFKLVASANH